MKFGSKIHIKALKKSIFEYLIDGEEDKAVNLALILKHINKKEFKKFINFIETFDELMC